MEEHVSGLRYAVSVEHVPTLVRLDPAQISLIVILEQLAAIAPNGATLD